MSKRRLKLEASCRLRLNICLPHDGGTRQGAWVHAKWAWDSPRFVCVRHDSCLLVVTTSALEQALLLSAERCIVVSISISLASAVETAARLAVKVGDGLGERSDNVREKYGHHERHDYRAQPDDKEGDQRETSDEGKESEPRRVFELEVDLLGKARPTAGGRRLPFAPHGVGRGCVWQPDVCGGGAY